MPLPISRWLLALLAICALAVGIDNMERPLANPDEGRYSEISREMAESGDWVTPRLNGFKYFEKPPLQYWATALSFKLFGENEYAARLYVALAGMLTVLMIGFTGWRIAGADTGLASMLVLASSPYFLALGGIVTLDMGLTLWTTATVCAFLLAENAAARPREQRAWMLAAWASMALAMLSKGLIGIVFAGAAVFFAIALRRDLSVLRRMHWGWGIAIFLLVAAPWFIAVSMRNDEFAWFFFVHEHFQRFLTTEHRRVEPAWYFLPVIAVGWLPWLFALPAAVMHAWKSDATRGAALRVALAWSAFVIVFFSASGSKLPAYVLPAFPLLALAIGHYAVNAPTRTLALQTALLIPVALVLEWYAGRVAFLSGREPWDFAMYVRVTPWAVAGATVVLVCALAASALFLRARRWLGIAMLTLGTVLLVECIEEAYEILSPRQSAIEVAAQMRPYLKPGTRVYSVGAYEQSLPFYLGRTVTLVDYEDEFALGQDAEPEKTLEEMDFEQDWLRPGEALAIMHPESYIGMKDDGLPMQVLHEDPRRVLVRKP